MWVDHEHGGMGLPQLPPTAGRVLGLDLGSASPIAWLAVALAVGYGLGLWRLHRRGVRWPVGRSLAWLAGCGTLFYVTASGLEPYSMGMFSLHMVQHMVLTMISPLFLLMGAPVTLALRGLPAVPGPVGMPRRALLGALHSRLAQAVASPLFTVPLFIASLYGVYFTPVFDDLMSTRPGHTLMLLHFLVTGLLFFGPILAVDPWPRRTGHGGRMLELLLPAPFHAFFGVIVIMSNAVLLSSYANPPAAWGVDPLYDQGAAGGIAWSFGEFPTVLVLAVVFFQWSRSEDRAARAEDRARDRAIARGESGDDPALAAYNERLRRMAAQQPLPPTLATVTSLGRLIDDLAAEGTQLERDVSTGALLVRSHHGRPVDPAIFLELTDEQFARHLAQSSGSAGEVFPDVDPTTAAYRLFLVHLDEE